MTPTLRQVVWAGLLITSTMGIIELAALIYFDGLRWPALTTMAAIPINTLAYAWLLARIVRKRVERSRGDCL